MAHWGGGAVAPKTNKQKYSYRMNTDLHMIVIFGCAWNPFVSKYRREVGCCEQGNEPSWSINGRELIDKLASVGFL